MKDAIWKEMICILAGILILMPMGMANEKNENKIFAEKGMNTFPPSRILQNGNLLPNPSFEEGSTTPTGWKFKNYGDVIGYTWDSNYAYSGDKSVGINMTIPYMSHDWVTSDYIPIDPLNHSYIMSVWYKYIGRPAHWQEGVLFVEGFDKNKKQLFDFGPVLNFYSDWHYFEWDVSHDSYFDKRARWIKVYLEYGSYGNSFSNSEIRFDDVYFGEPQYQPPVTRCITNPPSDGKNGWYINETTVTVQLDATDTREGVKSTFYSVNDEEWEEYTQPFTLGVKEGLNKISYYSIDKAGNEEETKSTFIRVDKTSPSIELITPQHGFYLNDKLIIPLPLSTIIIGKIHAQVELKDKNSGPWKVRFYVDDELEETVDNKPYTWLWKEKTPGRHILKVVAYDKAGNTIPKDIKVWIFNTPQETVDQQQTKYCGLGWGIWKSTNLAQGFVPSIDTITKVKLYMFKKGNPGSLKISIRSNLNEEDLTSVAISGSTVSTHKKWIEFDFPNIKVTPHQTYYIIWTPTGCDSNNVFYWALGDYNPYAKGYAWICRDGNWNEFIFTYYNNHCYPNIDFCFQTYGK